MDQVKMIRILIRIQFLCFRWNYQVICDVTAGAWGKKF